MLAVIIGTSFITALEVTSTTTPATAANSTCVGGYTDTTSKLKATPSHGQVMYIDSGVTPKVDAAYVGYKIDNTTGGSNRSNIWVALESFTGGKVTLANPADQYQQITSLNVNGTASVFFMLKAIGAATTAQKHTVKIYDKRPDLAGAATLLTCDFSFSKVAETIKASANKVTTVTKSLSPATATLGGSVTVSVDSAATGKVGSGSSPDFSAFWSSPAGVSSWPTRSLRLESTTITIDCAGNTPNLVLTNFLFAGGTTLTDCTGNGNGAPWTASYVFRIIGPGPSSLSPVPVAIISSGTQYKHSDIAGITNNTTLDLSGVVSSSIGVTVSAAGTAVASTANSVTIEYTVTISTTSTTALKVDEIVDTHQAGSALVSGSVKTGTTLASVSAAADPIALASDSGLSPPPYHFVGPYSVVSGTNFYIVYRFTIPCGSSSTNYATTVVAYTGDVLIGSSSTTASTATVSTLTSGAGCDYTVSNANTSLDPTVVTSPADSITASTANINAYANPAGGTGVTFRFVYATDPNLINAAVQTSWESVTGSSPLLKISALTGLSSITTYYYQGQIKNSSGTVFYGDILSFTTAAVQAAPSVRTAAASSIGVTSVTLNGSINPNLTALTGVFFKLCTDLALSTGCKTDYQVKTDNGSGTAVNLTFAANSAGDYQINSDNIDGTQQATSLTSGTTYYFKIFVTCTADATYCPGGSVSGSVLKFTTGSPSATTLAATSVGSTSATLNGIVNANSTSSLITFCYGTSATATAGVIDTCTSASATPSSATGSSDTSVSYSVSSLTAGTTYYYQVKANVSGSSPAINAYGAILSFKTLDITSTSPLAGGTVGSNYTASFTGTGGSTSYSWSTSSTLPAGLTLSSSGLLSGTPDAAGVYSIDVVLTDVDSGQTVTKTFQITINATITYAGNGFTSGSVPASQTGNGSVTLASAGTMAKSGYTFGGWVIGGQTYAAGDSYTLTTNVTATAVWTGVTYTVTYNKNDTSPTSTVSGSPTKASDSYVVGTTSPLSLSTVGTMTKAGYTFGGWSESANNGAGGSVVADPYTPSGSVTLYAIWTPNDYVITYNRNDGSGTTATQTLSYGNSTALSFNPGWTRTGYNFAGWASTNNGSALTSYTVTGTDSLYAVWTPDVFTITYAKNDGSGTTTSQDLNYGTTTALPYSTGFTRTGYTLAGWSLTNNGTVLTSYTVTENKTLYAIWTGNTYTITYDVNTADSGTPQRSSDTFTVGTSTAITLPTVGSMAKSGNTFVGWSATAGSNGAGGTAVSNPYTPTSSITLYAVWSTQTVYTVTFKSNYVGGAGDATQSGTTASALTQNPFTRTGYTFGGWSLTSTGSVAYANQASYSFAENKDLYAIWTANQYTVTYDANTASGSPQKSTDSYTVDSANGLTLSLVGNMALTGHSFGGWATSAGSRDALSSTDYRPTQDVTLYAIWTENTYLITYNYLGGTSGIATSSYTTHEPGITLPSSTRTGYTFGGWSTTNGGTSAVSDPYTTSVDRTLYAIWTPDVYVVTYNYKGGSGSTLSANYTVGTSGLTLPSGTKSYKVFGGWSTTDGGTTALTSPYVPSGSITLYAIWNDPANAVVTFNRGSWYTGRVASTTQGANTITNLSTNTYTRTGYSFSGWSLVDGSGTLAYADGASYDFSTDITLYAIWTPDVYTITYDYLGGTTGINYTNFTVGTSAYALPTSTKSTFVFGGWSLTNGGTSAVPSPYTPTSSVTLYAIWTAQSAPAPSGGGHSTIVITFVYNGGVEVMKELTLVSAGIAMTLPISSREHYNFGGWCATNGGNTPVSNPFIPTYSQTLYAIWTGKTYSVTLDPGKGPDELIKLQYVYGGDPIILPEVKKPGYKFLGWSAKAVTKVGIVGKFEPTKSQRMWTVWNNLPLSTPVYFGGDSPVIRADARATIVALARKVSPQKQRLQLVVDGWVKETKDKSYDLRLAKDRAVNTVAQFKARGIDAVVDLTPRGISPENTPKSRRTNVAIYLSGPNLVNR